MTKFDPTRRSSFFRNWGNGPPDIRLRCEDQRAPDSDPLTDRTGCDAIAHWLDKAGLVQGAKHRHGCFETADKIRADLGFSWQQIIGQQVQVGAETSARGLR